MAKNGFVISDLHIFARRSEIAKHFEEIEAAAKTSEFIVLNGDIFDFEWSTYYTINYTADEARSWLEKLANTNPQCQVYFIMGNHDSHSSFLERLKKISLPNFQWSPTHFIIDDSLFLHGDLPLSGQGVLERKNYEERAVSKSKTMSLIYDLVLRTHVQKIANLIYNKYTTAAKIHKAVVSSGLLASHDIKHIYFGHTHVPFNNFFYKGIYFHNTGSVVKNFKKNFIKVGNG